MHGDRMMLVRPRLDEHNLLRATPAPGGTVVRDGSVAAIGETRIKKEIADGAVQRDSRDTQSSETIDSVRNKCGTI